MAGAIAQATDPRARIGERYHLIECIRVDGGRQCWRAVDELLRRPVRVWLYTGLDPGAAAALRRRLQALHTVRHTGLVTVYDLIDHDEELAVITEVDPARPLADLLRTGQRPSLGTVRSIVSSLAEVLDELHLLGRTVSGLDAGDLLLRADGAAILHAPLAGPDREVTRPDIRARGAAIARPTPNTTTAPPMTRPAAGTGSATPSVLGMQRDDAARALMGAGAGSVIWRTEPLASGITLVVRQEPAPGQPLPRGAVVTVHLDSAGRR